MTEPELESLYTLDAEIRKTQYRIDELRSGGLVKAMDGMPHGAGASRTTEEIAVALNALYDMLIEQIKNKSLKEIEVRRFIETIPDGEIRFIAIMRYVHLMKWADIAAEMSVMYDRDVDRTTVSKKMRKFLKESL